MKALHVENAIAGYGAHDEIIKGVSLHVEPGEIVVIIGPNGAGKSTLLKMIAGLLRPRAGQIRFGEDPIGGLPPREISRRGIAYVPQEANIFGSMTIRDNLEVSGYLDRRGWRARAAENFRRFPVLAARPRLAARSLSGGQRQTLAMAMGLMVHPSMMLLDEPSAGLSPKAASELFEAIQSISAEGMTILMVEQNALEALRIADRAYVLVDGRNARDGDAAVLAAEPEVRRMFLGA
jgi:branched-chain amino acid transport system ATP-binding protein/neutral amino acid transport system ATP-binding protein